LIKKVAMQKIIFPPWPNYDEDEIEAVKIVLKSGKVNYWTGCQGRSFEREFAAYHQTGYGIALANGTVALELALRALGIGEEDDIIVPPRTFMASASSIVLCGGTPVFADVDRDSGNITPDSVRAVLTPRTRGIMAVHLAGWPCDMDGLMELAREKKLFVIEDCAQAHGAVCNGRPVGSIGHVGAFSFCQDKIMSTGGEGGMVITDDRDLWHWMWSYKDHGKSWDAVYNRDHPPGFRWLHESFGTNWRMTEMQAAIGRVQLEKLPDWVKTRRGNAMILIDGLSGVQGLRIPVPGSGVVHAYYKFYAYVRPEMMKPGWTRDRVVHEIQKQGIPCMQGSCSEVYLEKAFGIPQERLAAARELGETSLMLLVHPTLGKKEMEAASRIVKEVMAKAVQ
jgi:dTDP-4-amino-4,6-dideoxygalactose transaminase